MTSGFDFWDTGIWSFVSTLAILFGAMMIANFLRRKIRFLRRSLLPAAVLGGFIVLLADAGFKALFGRSMFELNVLESLTYHGLGLGFVALAWRHLDGLKGKKVRRDVFNTSTVTVGGYLIQGVVGLIITIVLSFVIKDTFAAGGVILPMGYGQGPGQAFNWGSIFENQYGFVNGTSYGLTIAAMGFVSACVGGVFYLNKLRRSGDPRAQRENAEELEDLSAEKITGGNEIPISESMDKLTVQFALVFITYFVAYVSMWALMHFVLEPLGGFAMSTINSLVWGFNFLIGTAWAILFKKIGTGLRKIGIMKREYTNNFMLNRISGVMFDVMVVSSIAAIDLSAFKYKEFWLPLVLVCVVGAVVTYFYTYYICKKLFPDYAEEEFVAMYGMLTGTASTGIILLREIDPYFKTPVSHNLIYQNLWSIVLGAPMLLLMGVVAKSMTMTWVTLGSCAILFVLILAIQFRKELLAKFKKSAYEEEKADDFAAEAATEEPFVSGLSVDYSDVPPAE